MTKRTTPDANQKDIEELINILPGCRFLDTHNVPYNLPELSGFPDGLIINEYGLTIFCNDPEAIIKEIQDIPGVSIWYGGIVPVEIKTAQGKMRNSQKTWSNLYGVKQVILRHIDDVFRIFNREIE
jgi:hypothetical protein